MGEQGPCIMNQIDVEGARDMISQAEYLSDRKNWLCKDCREELNIKKNNWRQVGVKWM